jgi:hypothetical protein
MTLQIIGAGLGRTGTYSMKAALERLGFGPCYHMMEVVAAPSVHLPHWQAAFAGKPDWPSLFQGYRATVDWPAAACWRELSAAYPQAKVLLTTRSTESWVASFTETIYKLSNDRAHVPEHMWPFLDNSIVAISRSGMRLGLTPAELARAYEAHVAAVQATIPKERLLVYEVKQGWGPLCAFLDKPVPSEPFPVSNGRDEFWEHVRGVR